MTESTASFKEVELCSCCNAYDDEKRVKPTPLAACACLCMPCLAGKTATLLDNTNITPDGSLNSIDCCNVPCIGWLVATAALHSVPLSKLAPYLTPCIPAYIEGWWLTNKIRNRSTGAGTAASLTLQCKDFVTAYFCSCCMAAKNFRDAESVALAAPDVEDAKSVAIPVTTQPKRTFTSREWQFRELPHMRQ